MSAKLDSAHPRGLLPWDLRWGLRSRKAAASPQDQDLTASGDVTRFPIAQHPRIVRAL